MACKHLPISWPAYDFQDIFCFPWNSQVCLSLPSGVVGLETLPFCVGSSLIRCQQMTSRRTRQLADRLGYVTACILPLCFGDKPAWQICNFFTQDNQGIFLVSFVGLQCS